MKNFMIGFLWGMYIITFMWEGEKNNYSIESTALGLAMGILAILVSFYINYTFAEEDNKNA